ncbi:unnamed protein product [Dicrocoelium dendriticum]|nr:unnamed protein product [Dicrocoelium dendriticum]
MKASDGLCSFSNGFDTIYESDFDDENYSGAENSVILERRRRSHTEAEQRRRNAIKKGYECLRELVYPSKCNTGSSAIRISKLSILNKSVSDIEKLGNEIHKKQLEVRRLEKVVDALRVLNTLYEERLKDNSPDQNLQGEPVSEDVKLQVFQSFADNLFSSFDSGVAFASFREFVDSILTWLEDSCKPESLIGLMNVILPMVLPFPSSHPLYSTHGALYSYKKTPVLPVSRRVSSPTPMIVPDSRPFDPSHPNWTPAVPMCNRIFTSESKTTDSISGLSTQHFKVSKYKQTPSLLTDPHELPVFHSNSTTCRFGNNTCDGDFSILRSSVMVTAPPQSSSTQCFPLSEPTSEYDYDNTQLPSLRGGSTLTLDCRGAELERLQPGDPPTAFQSLVFSGCSQQLTRNLPSDSDSFGADTAGRRYF